MKNIPYHFINACEECSLVMETPIQMTSCSLQLAGGMLQVKQAVLSLADRRNSLSCGWLTRRKESMVRSESQSTFVRVSWMVGRSISQVFAKGGGGGVEGGAAVSCAASYPAISVAVVTSLLPSQTVLNCSGTGISVNSPSLLGTKMFISELLALTISHVSESWLR